MTPRLAISSVDDSSVLYDGSCGAVGWPGERDELVGAADFDGCLWFEVLGCSTGSGEVVGVERDLFGCGHGALQALPGLSIEDSLSSGDRHVSPVVSCSGER